MSCSSDKNCCVNNEISLTKVDNSDNVETTASASLDAQTPVLSVTGVQRDYTSSKLNMLRSPSRESVGTDISLFSISTIASELTNRVKLLSVKTPVESAIISRGPSPLFDSKLSNRPENIREIWFEESNDMIKGMAMLSSVIGFSKSFSTSDITNLTNCGDGDEEISNITRVEENLSKTLFLKRNAISELALNIFQKSNYIFDQNSKLENTSRSCSTWVAVGNSTSQLPSPHDSRNPPILMSSSKYSYAPTFTPADLIRSVNKKVRQNYIRRRLLNTYKALERLSQSEFNLDKLEIEAAAKTRLLDSKIARNPNTPTEFELSAKRTASNRLSVPGVCTTFRRQWKNNIKFTDPNDERLTINDVERERGQPLSKYDRNMMIFNWLLTLESTENLTETY